MKVTKTRKAASKAKEEVEKIHHDHDHDNDHDEEEAIARGGVATPFPWKLHEMLEDAASEGNEHIVSWQSHGRSFIVHKPKVFVEKIMPTYFNQSKFASFQRQLNLYGFSRLTSGRDKGAYYHHCFVRGQRGLCRGMVRQKIKGTKVRRTLAPEEEPDFYAMAAAINEQTTQATTAATDKEQDQPMPSIHHLTGKERAIKEHQERMDKVRSVLQQTEDLCFDASSDFDQVFPSTSSNKPQLSFRNYHHAANSTNGQQQQQQSIDADAPVISPMDSVASHAEEEEEAAVEDQGRSSMANLPWTIHHHGQPQQNQQQVPFSISLPTMFEPLANSRSRSMSNEAENHAAAGGSAAAYKLSAAERTSSGDLLFFEGKPFHYLEHLESLPPRLLASTSSSSNGGVNVVKQYHTDKEATASAPYQNYQPRDTLQSLMRVDPRAIMSSSNQQSIPHFSV